MPCFIILEFLQYLAEI